MIQCRQGCFETNSSSTHALCLYKNNEKNIVDFTMDAVVKPFTGADYSMMNDPHVFVSAIDKLRYFWTIYNNLYISYEHTDYSGTATDFMKLLQEAFPNVSFAVQFEKPTEYHTYRHYVYLEDYDYVLSDYYNEYLVKKLTTVEDVKNFFINGVIVFGDRDLTDGLGDSVVENKIDEYTRISSVSG